MTDFCNLTGKTILMTGASSGIGHAAAILLSNLGAKLILLARNKEKLNQTFSQLNGSGHSILLSDISDTSTIKNFLAAHIKKTNCLLDGLVHAAGIHLACPLKILTEMQLENIFKVNVSSAIMLSKLFIRKNTSNRPSSIVFISSVVSQVGQPAISAYAISKGAISAAVKSLAIELAYENIRINSIQPGVVSTPMSENLFTKMGESQQNSIIDAHPLGLGKPEDIANAIAFLLSNEAKWITGSEFIVDGGYTAK